MKKFIHFVWVGIIPPPSLLQKMLNNAKYVTALWKKYSVDRVDREAPKILIWTSSELMANLWSRISMEWEGTIEYEVCCIDELLDIPIILPGEGKINSLLKWAIFIESTGTLRNLAVAADIMKIIILYVWGGIYIDWGLENSPVQSQFERNGLENTAKEDKVIAKALGTPYQPGENTFRFFGEGSHVEAGLFPAFIKNMHKFFFGCTVYMENGTCDLQILFSSNKQLPRVQAFLSPILHAFVEVIKKEKQYQRSSPPLGGFVDEEAQKAFSRDTRLFTFHPNPELDHDDDDDEEQVESVFKARKASVWTGVIMTTHFTRIINSQTEDNKGIYVFRILRIIKKAFFVDFINISLKKGEIQKYENYRYRKPAAMDAHLFQSSEKDVPFSIYLKKRPIPPFPTIVDLTADQPVCFCPCKDVLPIETLYTPAMFRGMERPIRCRRCERTYLCGNHNYLGFYSYASELIVLCPRCNTEIFYENPDIKIHLKKRPIPPFPTIFDPTAGQSRCYCNNEEVRPIDSLYSEAMFWGMEKPIRCRRCEHTHLCREHNYLRFYFYAGEPIVLCPRCNTKIFKENPDIKIHLVPRVSSIRESE